jgi:hypothetical protein
MIFDWGNLFDFDSRENTKSNPLRIPNLWHFESYANRIAMICLGWNQIEKWTEILRQRKFFHVNPNTNFSLVAKGVGRLVSERSQLFLPLQSPAEDAPLTITPRATPASSSTAG